MSFTQTVKIDPRHSTAQDATPLCFNSSWYDKLADKDRPYIIRIFVETQEIEIMDVTNKRVFLKRSPYPELDLTRFAPGNAVTIHGRQHNIIQYANIFTSNKLSADNEKCFAIIKPHAVKNLKVLSDVVDALRVNQLSFERIQLSYLERKHAEFVYSQHQNQSYFTQLVDSLVGNAIFFEIRGFGCIEKFKNIIGPRDPAQCAQNQLRKKYGIDQISNAFVSFDTEAQALQAINYLFQLRPISAPQVAEKTVVVILTPQKSAEIIDFILDRTKLSVSGIHAAIPTAADIQELMISYNGVIPCYKEYCDRMDDGICIAIEFEGPNAVKEMREICGPFDPEIARVLKPDSVRAKFGVDIVDNAVFITDIEEEAEIHSDFWFRVVE
ncbi:Nucleoside diphosphate kinase [Spironucleus salmonicida]|uniref:Nucleoside diphosphate kinase n=1 Tax=Spironucleus salmonicida TaxID=348837 RepID=V6LXQ7_9EUKA|nr:Nucleoside diphosphate kinase [Spironucleus salmonicida]|eukprot:EST49033.1 Nucleoside diphosphate kinase [Spironucleus salmonicida]